MILLVLAKTERTLGHSSINTQCTSIFIHSLAATNYRISPRRNSLPPPSHQSSGNIQRLSINNPKRFKDFSSTTRKYSKTFRQEPENFQRLFRLQNCPSRRSSICRKYSKTFRPASSNQQQQPASSIPATSSKQQQHPEAPTSSSNQQAVFQPQPAINQQPAANSSNQQKQSATATSSNQQQQSTAAINSSNKQRQPAFILVAAPTRSTPASVSYHYGS